MTVAYPDPAQEDGAAQRITREWSERYEELWDAADEHDEQELDPTRPSDLLPRDAA